MDVEKAIEKRCSIRKFKDKKVEEEKIKEILNAARLSPSGNNTQPWSFYIISDAEEKDKLKEVSAFHQDFVYEAGAIIVCCADPASYTKSTELDEASEKRALRDISIASAFMALRATELGLGTCYIGWVNRKAVKKALDIPEEFVLPFVIPLGYPAEECSEKKRKKLDEFILS